jgi:uncharacterized domain HDIG
MPYLKRGITMNSLQIRDSIKDLVENQCKKDSNIFGYEIWTYHIVVVAEYAKMLAQRIGADAEIVELAALLHDYAGIKDKNLNKDHHIQGAIEAEKILRQYEYPQDKIDKIKNCIIEHRGSVYLKQTSKEAVCLASADAMAHIDQVPSLLHLAYFKRKMGVDEGADWVKGKIERSWNKLCPEAQTIVNDKYQSAKLILKKTVYPINKLEI